MSTSKRWAWLAWGLAYLAMLAAVWWGVSQGRRAALRVYAGESAQGDWQQWRSDVGQQSESSPVQRRVPKSSEPPALVLMRDYYWQCLIGAWLLCSALGFTMAFLIRGVLVSS